MYIYPSHWIRYPFCLNYQTIVAINPGQNCRHLTIFVAAVVVVVVIVIMYCSLFKLCCDVM